MPERQRRELYALGKASEEFGEQFGREPSDEEMASVMGMPLKRVIKLRSSIRARIPLSVHEETDEEEGGSPDIAASSHTPLDDWHDAVYHGLGDIDRVIFMHRTGYRGADQLSNNAIAAKVGLTPSAVTQRAKRIQAQLDQFHGPGR
jgi:DNA-directed RNA polymerase specialized sigma subunit